MRISKAVLLIALAVPSSGVSPAMAQGTLASLANNLGSTIYPLAFGDLSLSGPSYRVELFMYDAAQPGGFGLQLGSTVGIGDNGRFNAGLGISVPGVAPGSTAELIVRAWNASLPDSSTYADANQRWVTAPFETGLLGGLITPTTPPLPPGPMVTGLPGGFNPTLTLVPPRLTTPVGSLANLANSLGAQVFPIFGLDGKTPLAGSDYRVQVFRQDTTQPGGLGVQIGSTVGLGDNGRFNAGNSIPFKDIAPNEVAHLLVRAWDARSGATFETARFRAMSAPFVTPPLGGDPDGDGPLLPITPPGMVSGLPDGFGSFSLTTIPLGTLARLSNLTPSSLVPIYVPNSSTPITGNQYKIEVITYDATQAGGFGPRVGSIFSPGANGAFDVSGPIEVPGSFPGEVTRLFVRAWDSTTGLTYETARIRGMSAPFVTEQLGGDPDGPGPLSSLASGNLLNGQGNGFHRFTLFAPGGAGLLADLSNQGPLGLVPIRTLSGAVMSGRYYKVEVFRFDSTKPGNYGDQLGPTVSTNPEGRFDAGGLTGLTGSTPGSTAKLLVRAWDTRSGPTYSQATIRGSTQFVTEPLGGDPDESGPKPTLLAPAMTSGNSDGFQGFNLKDRRANPSQWGKVENLANRVGTTVYPIYQSDGVTKLTGPNYKVEVFLYSDESNPFAIQLGETTSTTDTGLFNAGSLVRVPGQFPGTRAQLIVRAWDVTQPGGDSYETAFSRGKSAPFYTDYLGGNPNPESQFTEFPVKGMVTGKAGGFTSFRLDALPVPEPGVIALSLVGGAALLFGRRRESR